MPIQVIGWAAFFVDVRQQKSRPPPTISGERTTLAIGLYVDCLDCLDSVIFRFRIHYWLRLSDAYPSTSYLLQQIPAFLNVVDQVIGINIGMTLFTVHHAPGIFQRMTLTMTDHAVIHHFILINGLEILAVELI